MTQDFRGIPLDNPMTMVNPEDFGLFPRGTKAWRWQDADDFDEDWFPQGITSFERDGQRIALISWYHQGSDEVRISYLTRRPDSDGKYWYGTAYLAGDHAQSHAGGLAFRHSALWVAITRYGVASFRATRPRRSGDRFYLDGMTSTNLVDAISDPKKKFVSFTDVDWTDGGNTLLTGVYSTFGATTRLPAAFTWPLDRGGPDPDGGEEHLGITEPGSEYSNLQGVAKFGETWFYSQSGRFDQVRRSDGSGSLVRIIACDRGLEDLHITSSGRYLLGLTEAVESRIVFQVDLRSL